MIETAAELLGIHVSGHEEEAWYGRVLVERVEGFAQPKEWKRAYDEINEFERLLIDDGARIVKLFFHITEDEQLARFASA